MRYIRFSTEDPYEHIAMDELMLTMAESGDMGESIRFWGSGTYFAVLGRSCPASSDCQLDICSDEGIPVIRRVSGGGTVLQGPGCYNYSAVLAYDSHEDFRNITGSYKEILGRIIKSVPVKELRYFPVSDLAVGDKKVSGNAQARKKRYFLHHGTFLLDFDIDRIGRYLGYPASEPEYRKGRTHADFLTNLMISRSSLEDSLLGCIADDRYSIWEPSVSDLGRLRDLVDMRYMKADWNYSF